MSDRVRVLVSAGYSEGHAFPALALSRALGERGHEVMVELSERWRDTVGGLGFGFTPARDYVLPGAAPAGAGEPTAIDVARSLVATIGAFDPDVVVSDLVAAAPALAAEVAEVPNATLIPTVYPVQGRGLPPFQVGLVAPRTGLGSVAWRAIEPAVRPLRPNTRWLRRVSGLLGAARAELGLPPLPPDRPVTTYGTVSEGLAMVATFPQLEYPRDWPARTHVTGPMQFELEHPDVELPPGDRPLVLVAASTVHGGGGGLIRAALRALEAEPVRILATINARGQTWSEPAPENTAVVDWLSYGQVMPRAAVVITSGGHGTVARALAAGVPVLVCPGGAESAENGARVTWAGAGLMLPSRLQRSRALRSAVRRLLDDGRFAARAKEIAAWARANDGARRGAELVERYARR